MSANANNKLVATMSRSKLDWLSVIKMTPKMKAITASKHWCPGQCNGMAILSNKFMSMLVEELSSVSPMF